MRLLSNSLVRDCLAILLILYGLLLVLSNLVPKSTIIGFSWPLLLLIPGILISFEGLMSRPKRPKLIIVGYSAIAVSLLLFFDLFTARVYQQFLNGAALVLFGLIYASVIRQLRGLALGFVAAGVTLILLQTPAKPFILPAILILVGAVFIRPRKSSHET